MSDKAKYLTLAVQKMWTSEKPQKSNQLLLHHLQFPPRKREKNQTNTHNLSMLFWKLMDLSDSEFVTYWRNYTLKSKFAFLKVKSFKSN